MISEKSGSKLPHSLEADSHWEPISGERRVAAALRAGASSRTPQTRRHRTISGVRRLAAALECGSKLAHYSCLSVEP